jgi:N-acetyl-anhydromuramyl-L-alanine amidase AmpD
MEMKFILLAALALAAFPGAAVAQVTDPIAPIVSSRIANFSARAMCGLGDQTLIMGFAVSGDNKTLLVRGIGPTLASFGISNALADPVLTMFNANSAIATNDDWQIDSSGQAQGPLMAATAARVGAFALPNGSKDSALLITVNKGDHTTGLLRPTSPMGIALVEVHDTDTTVAARLVSVSARAQVGTGENILIAGFIITGNAPKTVLIRGVGPTLAMFGVTGVLADPQISLYSGTTLLAANDNWETGNVAELTAAAALDGAFPLLAGSKDAALVAILPPGSYTVQVSGVANTTGVALVEIYNLTNPSSLAADSFQGEPAVLKVSWEPSPYFNDRPLKQEIDAIVIHTTEGPTKKSAIDTLLERGLSAHYVIDPEGNITQLVELSERAWHATYYNDRSIGIEMVGMAAQSTTWNPKNLGALADLVAYLVKKYPTIPVVHPLGSSTSFDQKGLVGHSQIQPPPDKFDPGPYFDWTAFVQSVTDRILSTVADEIDPHLVTFNRYTAGGSVSSWISAGCVAAGVPANSAWITGYETAIGRESSGDANACNIWDENAITPQGFSAVADWGNAWPASGVVYLRNGALTPFQCSRGVAQCIPQTFAMYHAAGTSLNIYDPAANIAASINYVRDRYGVSADGSDLASKVQQFDPNRSPKGYWYEPAK